MSPLVFYSVIPKCDSPFTVISCYPTNVIGTIMGEAMDAEVTSM